LCFSREEIWKFMPDSSEYDARSVCMNQMPEKLDITVDESFTEKWDTIYKLRSDVTKALEAKRQNKFIGAPLEAKVTIYAGDYSDKFGNF
ncbi:MAG: hypothetical protein K2G04_03090, partial [Oscillospiraceae bacterium]|nr:hypothetical protein [Oscillospiraceae bacterium]